MCGIFGFTKTNSTAKCDADILSKILNLASTRGPFASGIAYIDDNTIETHKQIGIIKDDVIKIYCDCKALIGNCRMPTSGSYRNARNNQPIVLEDDIAISHNGNIYNYQDLSNDIHANLETDCDSVIIAHMVKQLGTHNAITQTVADTPSALLILQNNKLTIYRNKLPLYFLEKDGVIYYCSREFENTTLLPQNEIMEVFIYDTERQDTSTA